MENYIEILIGELGEHWTDILTGEYFLEKTREDHAEAALMKTLTKTQRDLFMIYEEHRNAAASLRESAMARQAFLMAREIFR